MSNIVKREKNEIMPNVMFPMMPEIVAEAMPISIPELGYDAGLIGGLVHGFKTRRLVKDAERQSEIAKSKNGMLSAKLDSMFQVMTFSTKVNGVFEEAKHANKRREHESKMWDFEEQQSQAGLMEQQLKNMLLKNEVKLSELEFDIKNKEYRRLLEGEDGDGTSED